MNFDRRFDEKIDVIDLIINVLKEHEKTLDELVSRLEEAQSIQTPIESLKTASAPQAIAVRVVLKNWSEFRRRGEGSDLIAFNMDGGHFKVNAFAGGVLYVYEEEIPGLEIHYKMVNEKALIDSINIGKAALVPTALRGKLDCGIEFSKREIELKQPNGASVHKIIYDIDPRTARSWVAYQLEIDEEKILQGELRI
jgi:hypothetical protein